MQSSRRPHQVKILMSFFRNLIHLNLIEPQFSSSNEERSSGEESEMEEEEDLSRLANSNW